MVRPDNPVLQATAIALVAGLLAGLLIGTALGPGLSIAPPSTDAPGDSSDSSPAYSLATASGCYDGPREHGGWVHVVASGQTWGVTLNATIVHDRGVDVRANVSRTPTGTYEIALVTVDATDRKPPRDCRPETSVDLAAGLPTPEFAVTLDGRTVLTVDQEETTANLYPLPEPLNATTSG